MLQECNLVLWRKAGEFRADSDFIPWAFGIARFQVMAHLRDQKREQARLLDPDLAELLHEEVARQAGRFDEMQAALRICLGKLPAHGRELLERRYFRRHPVQQIAEQMKRSLSAVKVSLKRGRQSLRECIERDMAKANAQ